MCQTHRCDDYFCALTRTLAALVSFLCGHLLLVVCPSREWDSTTGALYVFFACHRILPWHPFCLLILDCFMALGLVQHHARMHQLTASFAATSTISLMHLTLSRGCISFVSALAAAIIPACLERDICLPLLLTSMKVDEQNCLPVLPADRLLCYHLAALLLLSLSSLPKWHALSPCLLSCHGNLFLITAPLQFFFTTTWMLPKVPPTGQKAAK